MSLLLHNVGPIAAQLDAQRQLGSERYDIVATNPPFGRKSSIKVIGEEGGVSSDAITIARDDFWAITSNEQG